MKIDASCGEIINSKEVYIHDDILEEFNFNREEKKLHLIILEEGVEDKRFSIDFIQVIGFEITSCDFWGESPYIYDFEYVDQNDTTIIPKLFEIKNNNDYPHCSLNDKKEYFETIITFISGDQLRVACKEIII